MTLIEQATRILGLIRSEVAALATLAGHTDAGYLIAAGDRAREIAPWLTLGEALGLTEAEMTGAEPLPAVETAEQASEIIATVRDHLAALRAQIQDGYIPLDETDHHELAQAARRLADRAAVMRQIAICEDVLGEAPEVVPLPVLAAARRAADRRAADALARLRVGVQREVAARGEGRRREVMRAAGITPATLYSWAPAVSDA